MCGFRESWARALFAPTRFANGARWRDLQYISSRWAQSCALENYVPRASRGELTSSGGSRSTWLKDVAGGVRLSCKNSFPGGPQCSFSQLISAKPRAWPAGIRPMTQTRVPDRAHPPRRFQHTPHRSARGSGGDRDLRRRRLDVDLCRTLAIPVQVANTNREPGGGRT